MTQEERLKEWAFDFGGDYKAKWKAEAKAAKAAGVQGPHDVLHHVFEAAVHAVEQSRDRLDALRYWINGREQMRPCPHCGEPLPAMPDLGRGEAGP